LRWRGCFNAAIAPFAEFTGDRERSSWLVSEDLAWSWRAFSSRFPKARIITPGHANVVLHQDRGSPPVRHLECGVRAGVPFETSARAKVPDMVKIEFFANTAKLGESTAFAGGETALSSTRNVSCAITAVIPDDGIYGLMARYTTGDGTSGWTRPMPLVVWPARRSTK
jgi:hypothetical protein